jgi:glycosyltransferase involved in cell wall biosynthesis
VGLIAGGHSGLGRYTVSVARALDEVSPDYPGLRLSLLTTEKGAEAVAPAHIPLRRFRPRGRAANEGPVRFGIEQLALPAQRADLLHFFDLSGPLLPPRRPFVTTMHDAQVAYGMRPVRQAYKRRLWPWALRHARAVVAVSEFTKSEAVRLFGADPAKVHVVHSGPGFARDGSPLPGAVDRFPGPALLYVGNLAEYKNLRMLVRAYDRAGVEAPLLLVGRPDTGFDALRAEIDRLPGRGRVRVVHDASDAELEALYSKATALLHPSWYEGFGFTPLEAMARGCPVVASDIPPIREVSGEGALLVAPDDEAGWADAISRVASDAALRADLSGRGERVVSRYSWQAAARRLCELFLTATGRR